MKATRLHIINDGDNETVMNVAYHLLSFGNKLVRIACGDEVVDKGCVVEELFKMCIDELEFIVCSDFDKVIDELDYVLSDVNYEVDMEFVVEVEDGYVYLMPEDVRKIALGEEEDNGNK
jgi:hypothetical protein